MAHYWYHLGQYAWGGIAPDLDQPTAGLWQKIPAGSLFGRIVKPFLGTHRMIAHSLIGVFLAGFLMQLFLNYTHKFLLVNNNVVLFTFVLGYLSHLL